MTIDELIKKCDELYDISYKEGTKLGVNDYKEVIDKFFHEKGLNHVVFTNESDDQDPDVYSILVFWFENGYGNSYVHEIKMA